MRLNREPKIRLNEKRNMSKGKNRIKTLYYVACGISLLSLLSVNFTSSTYAMMTDSVKISAKVKSTDSFNKEVYAAPPDDTKNPKQEDKDTSKDKVANTPVSVEQPDKTPEPAKVEETPKDNEKSVVIDPVNKSDKQSPDNKPNNEATIPTTQAEPKAIDAKSNIEQPDKQDKVNVDQQNKEQDTTKESNQSIQSNPPSNTEVKHEN